MEASAETETETKTETWLKVSLDRIQIWYRYDLSVSTELLRLLEVLLGLKKYRHEKHQDKTEVETVDSLGW